MILTPEISKDDREATIRKPFRENNTINMSKEAQVCFESLSETDRGAIDSMFISMSEETNAAFVNYVVDAQTQLDIEHPEILVNKRIGIKLIEASDENKYLEGRTVKVTRRVGEQDKDFYQIGVDMERNTYLLNQSEDKLSAVSTGNLPVQKPQSEVGYAEAKTAPGSIAAKYVPTLLDLADIHDITVDEINEISTAASVYDSTDIAGNVLKRYGIDTSVVTVPFNDAETVHKILLETDPNVDTYYRTIDSSSLGLSAKSIDELELQRSEFYKKLGGKQRYEKFIEITARAKQATWFACQDERAIYENNPERITTKLNYNSFDGMVITQTADALINLIDTQPELRTIFDSYNLRVEDYRKSLKEKDNAMVADFLARAVSILKGSRLVRISDQEYENQKLLIQNALGHSLLRAGFELHKDIIEPIK